jgi:thiamine biosynthesis lipoprotein
MRREIAFGSSLELEVRGLGVAEAQAALGAAWAAVRVAEQGVARSALDQLAVEAPSGSRRDLLLKAVDFCLWSDGAVSPLGRRIHDLWGLRRPAAGIPQPAALAAVAVRPLDCSSLRAALQAPARPLPADYAERLDLRGFERGFAVDRAVEALRAAGARNGRVGLGPVSRAFGSGPAGEGWPIVFRPFAGQATALDPALLRDRALAVASRSEALVIGGERVPAFFDQRSGRPGEGKAAVLVSTDLAVDAEALAMALFVMPTREGEFRAGTLRPQPSLLWLLGNGEGEPLALEARWSALRR